MKDIKGKIEAPYEEDRHDLVIALVNSGYKVWVEQDDNDFGGHDYTINYESKK